MPAETPTVPPPTVVPPENVAEILRRHGNEVLPGLAFRVSSAPRVAGLDGVSP